MSCSAECTTPRSTECHCAACHQTFGTLKLFDAHQDVDYSRTPAVICQDPAAMRVSLDGRLVDDGVPLVADDRGVWQTQAGLAHRQRAADLLRAVRQPR